MVTNASTTTENPPHRFPWRMSPGDFAWVLVLFALSRGLLVLAGIVGWNLQLQRSNWRGIDRSGIRYALVADQPMLDMWTRWDSWEYEEIARKGYWYDGSHWPQAYGTVACFPLYPLAIRGVGMLLGGRYVVAGLVVSNLSALSGFLLIFQWANWWGDRRSAWVAVSAAILFPGGLFWSALYPQSLYFALSTACLVLMLDGRVALASLVGAAVTATRLEGIVIWPALLGIYLQDHRGRIGRDALWLLLAPMGLLGYMGFLYEQWGNPLLFLKVHAIFGRGFKFPLWTLIEPWKRSGGLLEVGVVFTYTTGVLLILGHVARLRWPILLYGWSLFLVPLCTGSYISIYRVHLVNAPIYLALGLGLQGGWRWLAWSTIVVFEGLQIWMMAVWVAGYFLP